ncbi:hypothetical protein GGX14DRAFT_623156 [Mycena pura]|uniref:Uncharacterized protein n=1 Tax=Mycena pura TaxID=153505 RepID=A0AAD6VHH6_9AGAR|nr:hypothetical protein GGX14DRAFT_623156 [Mycena pura]
MSTAPASDHPAPAPCVSESGTVLQKTARRFQLLPNPIEATDALWRAYANNRLTASSIRKRDKKAEAEGYESPESDDWFVRDDSIHVLRSIREEEMLLPDGVLQKSVAVLNCEAAFEEADDPRTVSTLSRIYSPSRPVYTDVHLACAATTSNGTSVCDTKSVIAPRDSGQQRKNPWSST